MSLLQEFQPVSQESQSSRSNEFWLKGFYGVTVANWLSGGHLLYLDRVAEIGEQGSPKMVWIDLVFGGWLAISADFWGELYIL